MTKQVSDRVWATMLPKFTSGHIVVQGTPGHVFLQTLVEAASSWVPREAWELSKLDSFVMTA